MKTINDVNQIFVTFSPIISAIIGATLMWLFSRKKQESEINKAEVEMIEKAARIWRDLAGDLGEQVEQLKAVVEDLKQENKNLKREIAELSNKK